MLICQSCLKSEVCYINIFFSSKLKHIKLDVKNCSEYKANVFATNKNKKELTHYTPKTEYKRLNSADVNKHLSNNDVTVVCDKCKKNILFEDCIETIDHRTLCKECFDNEEPTRLD